VRLLASGRVDAAATFETALKELLAKDPSLKVQVLKRFNKLPNAVLVTRASMEEAQRQALLDALQTVWTEGRFDSARAALVDGAAMDGLVPADEHALESVESWLE
jgi:ABC-type phosphate/phosphonate transport system substrate-binding protein